MTFGGSHPARPRPLVAGAIRLASAVGSALLLWPAEAWSLTRIAPRAAASGSLLEKSPTIG
ncbi:unnamed protein product, partial [Ectocarpus fasciculatus]